LTPINELKTAERAEAIKKTPRLGRTSKFFKTIIGAIEEKKGENLVSLDLKKIPEAVADFFIICQANSSTQIKAIADYVEKEIAEQFDEMPYRREGYQCAQWILIDFVDVVVHIMHPEARAFYKIEELWSDANLKEHE
jgi:ribosome-associated protein